MPEDSSPVASELHDTALGIVGVVTLAEAIPLEKIDAVLERVKKDGDSPNPSFEAFAKRVRQFHLDLVELHRIYPNEALSGRCETSSEGMA